MNDRGSASIFALAGAAVVAVVAVAAVVVAWGSAVHRKATMVADLSALAAAEVSVTRADQACARARQVAEANGAVLGSCRLDGGSVRVVVRVVDDMALLPPITASARAGPRPP